MQHQRVNISQLGSMKLWIAIGLVVVLLAAAAGVYVFMPEKISYLHKDQAAPVATAIVGEKQAEPVKEAPVVDHQAQTSQTSQTSQNVEATVAGSTVQVTTGHEAAGTASNAVANATDGEAAMIGAATSGESVATAERADRGLALIMDDTGYGMDAVEAALALGVPVTFSILPNAPDAAKAAEKAHTAGQLVMLHMPMEPKDPDIADQMMGKIGLVAGMNEAQLHHQVDLALNKVPYASGMSNHMGSMLTEQADSMRWLMQDLKQRHMFFLDSLTTNASVARVLAAKMGVAWASRRFFLDNDASEAAMQRMWHKILKRAAKKGGCIVIYHASPSSLAFLKNHVQEAEGLVVPLTALLHPAA